MKPAQAIRGAALAAVFAVACGAAVAWAAGATPSSEGPLQVSGIYPHLAVYNDGGNECGIGAVVPWAGRLWLITYPPHATRGSPDKLYEIDDSLRQVIRPESVGGTHAGRLIHRESQQLIIGPYFIDAKRNVRAADLAKLVGRMTAVARHLNDPANLVYMFDMEGAIYEVNVRTLEVRRLFEKPVPGWHGKGAYTSQGRLVIANNGEAAVGSAEHEYLVSWDPSDREAAGALAEWDGKTWRIVERRQFCEVTGPGGILGAPDDSAPLWATGWDRRSVILKLLDRGRWYTFRLPKASHTFDPKHGWYTEWPRIREIAPGRLMMVMHGMMYDFPPGFRQGATGGLRPLCSHLRYVTDFCNWNGRLVIAADDTSIMKNPMAGLSQSNMWFGRPEDLARWGPRAGWGGPWLADPVKAGTPSDPFLVGGFERRCLHLAVGPGRPGADGLTDAEPTRCTGELPLVILPDELADLARVTVPRGDFHKPAPPYAFTISHDAVVYMAVDGRPKFNPPEGWEKTDLKTRWRDCIDTIYRKTFKAGRVDVPGHPLEHKPNAYGVPHMCFVAPVQAGVPLKIEGAGGPPITVTHPQKAGAAPEPPAQPAGGDVTFTLEIDAVGDGLWTEYAKVVVPEGGYRFHILPADLRAEWIRLRASRDCTATAYFHLSAPWPVPAESDPMFQSLADAGDSAVCGGIIRPAGHNRSLQWLVMTAGGDAPSAGPREGPYLEGDERLTLASPPTSRADEVKQVAAVTRDFQTDAASVIMTHKGRRYRLPKGDDRFDGPLPAGLPRGIREIQSERYMANVHGTFYEIPRDDGLPLLRPVASHGKQIMDYCTWRGLLVLSGTKPGARPDGHYFAAPGGVGLWFGCVDDLWRLGKPRGRGGPWRDSAVRPGEPSDPYLMTNYDRKSLRLSHDGAEAVEFTVEVDFDHRAWWPYQTIRVPPGQTVTHVFPEGYGAHWVRLKSSAACKATAEFVYE